MTIDVQLLWEKGLTSATLDIQLLLEKGFMNMRLLSCYVVPGLVDAFDFFAM